MTNSSARDICYDCIDFELRTGVKCLKHQTKSYYSLDCSIDLPEDAEYGLHIFDGVPYTIITGTSTGTDPKTISWDDHAALWLSNFGMNEEDCEDDYIDLENGKYYNCTHAMSNETQLVRIVDELSDSDCETIVALVKNGQETAPIKVNTEDFHWEEAEAVESKPYQEDKKYEPSCESQYDLLVF